MLETKPRPSPYASKAIWQNAYIPLLCLLTVLQASTLSSVPETLSNFQFTCAHMHERARACSHPEFLHSPQETPNHFHEAVFSTTKAIRAPLSA